MKVAGNGWLAGEEKTEEQKLIFDKNKDKKGPINIGIAFNRTFEEKGQRAIVVGNAAFSIQ